MKRQTLIIAEAGVNHNGDIAKAYDMIDAAADTGVNIVKFQTFSAERLVTKTAVKAAYQEKNSPEYDSQYDMLKALELSRDEFSKLKSKCNSRDIEFLTTGFDISDLEFIASIDLPRLKIPSGEITNLPYLRYIGKFGKPIILSTGMSTLSEVGAALQVLEDAGTNRSQITVLHCNTEYPTPFEDVNLKAMLTLKNEFGVDIGYSDHTLGIEVPIAAAALGATVIEKHFTMDKRLPGPDHRASLEPNELKLMVTAIRNIEMSLGDGKKVPSKSEKKNISVARKSIVASKDIKEGEVFTESNITTKRPGGGKSPMEWDAYIGCMATRNYKPDEMID